MDIGATFIADLQPTIPVEPGQRALDHPAMATEPFAGVDAFAGDPDPDVTTAQRGAAARDVVALVGMQLARAFAPPPVGLLDGPDAIEQSLKDDPVVAVGSGQECGEAGCRSVSTTRWRLLPGLPRSVGFRPLSSPPFWPPCWPSPTTRDSSRSGRLRPSDRATPDGADPRRRLPGSRAISASTSRRSHNPAPAGASPTGDTRFEDEDDPGQGGAIRHARSITLELGGFGRQQRGDEGPQFVAD